MVYMVKWNQNCSLWAACTEEDPIGHTVLDYVGTTVQDSSGTHLCTLAGLSV